MLLRVHYLCSVLLFPILFLSTAEYGSNFLVAAVDVCEGSVVQAFYKIEVLIGSKAALCGTEENGEIALVLQQLVNQALEDSVPNIIEATTILCPHSRRRNLLEQPTTTENIINNNNNNQNESSQDKHPILSSHPLQNNDSALRRILSLQFVYRGGSRCTYCLPDDSDLRRLEDDPSCRQKYEYILPRGNEGLNGWTNRRIYDHGVKDPLLGLYSNNEMTSKVITVPSWSDLWRMRIGIFEISGQWDCSTDHILLELNGEPTIIQPFACHPEGAPIKQRFKKYSVASERISSSGYGVPAVKVVVASGTKLVESTGTLEVRLTAKTSSTDKKVAFGNLYVRADDTCTAIKPNHIKKEENRYHISTHTFEQVVEEILTKSVSRAFRDYVDADPDHCLNGANPTVYINLFQKNTWEEVASICD